MRILIGLLIIGMMYGCASVKSTSKESVPEESVQKGKFDESFDPLTLNDDDIIIGEKEINPSGDVKAGTDKDTGLNRTAMEPVVEVDGFRVQILATKNIETATLVQQEATDQFGVLKFQTYLTFEAPLYKVRVGNAIDRIDAERIRDIAKDYGYKEAFIVRSKVLVPEEQESAR
ncbi:MAG: SPOR domain-containing protein [Calditrichaceae bacterium]